MTKTRAPRKKAAIATGGDAPSEQPPVVIAEPMTMHPVAAPQPLVILVHEETREELEVSPNTWRRMRAFFEAQGYRHPLEPGTIFTPLAPHQHAPRG